MYLTMECDYGMRIIRALAGTVKLSVRAIAQQEEMKFAFTQKIIEKLSTAGYVRCDRGNRGGYYLIRPAHTISLWDVYCAVDPGRFLCACLNSDKKCPLKTNDKWPCKVHKKLQHIQNIVVSELKKISMEEIAYHPESQDQRVKISTIIPTIFNHTKETG